MDSRDSEMLRPARGRGWVVRAVVAAVAVALVVGGAFALPRLLADPPPPPPSTTTHTGAPTP